MPEHISSSMYASDMNKLDVERLKAFIRAVVVAKKKVREKDAARQELNEHIAKIKKAVSVKNPSSKKLKNHVAEIENKINYVLQKEAKLLRSSAYENETITALHKEIDQLEREIDIKDAERKNLLRMNQENIRNMGETIDMLKRKIESYAGEKSERERRMQELEDRIRKKVELGEADKRLAMLEAKLKELEQKEVYDEDDISRIKMRIDQLKTSM